MTKTKNVFACVECGAVSPRWHGKCPTCGAWNALHEEVVKAVSAGKATREAIKQKAAAPKVVSVSDVIADDAERIPSGNGEFDRVVGGGLVRGGVVLLGGDPGVGKSTLLMQVLAGIAKRGEKVLYVTGEESAAQIGLRARRIGGEGMSAVRILATTELDDVERAVVEEAPSVIVVDSVQTVRSGDLESGAGTVSQLREVSVRLTDIAKRNNIAMLLIGHVTKDGALAGPKVLEHLVDAVLSFEGEREYAFRVLRATKNRFGPAAEIGVFEMLQEGLREVLDPSALFLAERPKGAAGSVVVPTVEGTRPLLVEVQSLVAPAVYGSARRVASGIDSNRMSILLAVLERKAELHVADRDVFVSVAGGVRISERAVDLAVALAIASSFRNRPVADDLVVVGELGLAGEVRAVTRMGARVGEAKKLGHHRIILPKSNLERLTKSERAGMECIGVGTLAEALEAALD